MDGQQIPMTEGHREVPIDTGDARGTQVNDLAEMRAKAAEKLGFTDPSQTVVRAEKQSAAPAAEVEEEDDDTLTDRDRHMKALREQVAGGGVSKAEDEELPEAVAAYFKTKGIDPNDVKGIAAMKIARDEGQRELESARQQLERFGKIPTKLKNAIAAFDMQDPDWEKHLKVTGGLDFSKPFSKQGKGAMLKAYAEGKVTDQELKDYTDDVADDATKSKVEAYLELAKTKYELEAKQVEGFLTEQSERQETYNKALKESRNASLARTLTRTPAAAPFKKEIAKALTPQGVLDFYFDPKTQLLRPEAADLIVHAMLSKEVVAPAQQRAVTEAKNTATLDVVRRTAEAPPPAGGQGSSRSAAASPQEKAREEAVKRLKFG